MSIVKNERQSGSPVTAEQAHESHQRLVDYFWGNPAERPRVSIPARLDRDDDLVVSRYIDQAEAELRTLRARVAELEWVHAWKVVDMETMIQNEHKLYADAHERMLKAEARVKELETRLELREGHYQDLLDGYVQLNDERNARITDLESQLAAALEAKG